MNTLHMIPRTLLLIVVASLSFTSGFSQRGEFQIHDNGLIYSDTTMKQLKFIVDSLNLKFKVCDLSKEYYSIPQVVAYRVKLDTGKEVKDAFERINKGISYEDFMSEYTLASSEKMLVLKDIQQNWKKEFEVTFTGISVNTYSNYSLEFTDTSMFNKPEKGKWVSKYHEATKYSRESLEAFYFPAEFETKKLPVKYSKMVQYADCMIDTNVTVFFKDAEANAFFEKSKKPMPDKVDSVFNYLEKMAKKPKKPKSKKNWDGYAEELYNWEEKKDSIVNKLMHDDPLFRDLFLRAVKEAVAVSYGNKEFESYAEKYGTARDVLALKRARIVVGGCSQDQSPRYHALDIARLSAETINWEIFLRAHLDIMNDNFQRVSDGSYAWGRRETYIKELEQLDFDVPSLLFGIALRINNPSGTHYFGDVGRLGRAITESRIAPSLENNFAVMMADSSLDDFNRIIFYYLYRSYAYSIYDTEKKEIALASLENAAKHLPSYIMQPPKND